MKKQQRILAAVAAATMTVLLTVPAFAAEKVEGGVPNPTAAAKKFQFAPVLDGKLAQGEWGAPAFTLNKADGKVYKILTNSTHTVADNLPATETKVYLGYTVDRFYVCVEATYADHKNDALTNDKLWQGDCVQMMLSANIDGHEMASIDFGYQVSADRPLAWIWTKFEADIARDPQSPGAYAGAMDNDSNKLSNNKTNVAKRDYYIQRSGNTTVYELSFPLKAFTKTKASLNAGDKLGLTVAQGMHGPTAGSLVGWYSWGSGLIVPPKTISTGGVVTLSGDAVPGVDQGQGQAAETPDAGNVAGGGSATGGTGSTGSGSTGKTSGTGTTGSGAAAGGDAAGAGETGGTDGAASDDFLTGDLSGEQSDAIDSDTQSQQTAGKPAKSNLGLIVGIVIVGVAILGAGAAAFIVLKPKKKG